MENNPASCRFIPLGSVRGSRKKNTVLRLIIEAESRPWDGFLLAKKGEAWYNIMEKAAHAPGGARGQETGALRTPVHQPGGARGQEAGSLRKAGSPRGQKEFMQPAR